MEIDNMIPKEALKEFKELYRKKFQAELSDEKTYRQASKLLNLYRVIYGRDHKTNPDNIKYDYQTRQ